MQINYLMSSSLSLVYVALIILGHAYVDNFFGQSGSFRPHSQLRTFFSRNIETRANDGSFTDITLSLQSSVTVLPLCVSVLSLPPP